MKMNEAIEYITDQAKRLGYAHHELEMLKPDIREMLYNLPNTDKDDLDKLILEVL
jgi:hypothetical protein